MEKSKMADQKEAAAGRSSASNRTTVKQMDPTLIASASVSSSNNSKQKKKRESKEVRLARREAKALKEIYAPKDSRVSLITPAIMKLFNNSSRGNRSQSTSTSTSFPSNQVPSGNEKLMTGVEFPTISQSSIAAPKQFKPPPPPQPTPVSIEPQGDDETTSSNVRATIAAAVRKSKKNDTPSKNPIMLNLKELIHATPLTSQNRKTKKRDRGAGQDARKEAMMHKFSTNSNVLDSSGPILLHRGKIRLNRKKRTTALKKAILLSRALRKEKQSKSLESEQALIDSSVVDPDLTTLPLQSLSISDADPDAVDIAADSADNTDVDVGTCDLKGTSKVGAETRETQEHSQGIQNAGEPTEKSTSVKEIDSSSQKIVSGASEIVPHTPVSEPQQTSSTEADYGLIFRKLLEEALLCSTNRSTTDGTTLSTKTAQNEAESNQKMVESTSNNFKVVGEVLEKAKDKMHKNCKKWRPYCDMYTSHELHGEVIALLLELHRFQDRLYHSDPIKFQNNKRYVHGLKEVSASLQRNKVQLLIIAPDVEPTPGVKGGLEDKMEEVLGVAKSRGIPYLFSGHRFILGKPIRIKRPVSIIGILNKQGAEELVEKVMKHVARLRDLYTFDLNAFITQVEEEQQSSTQVKSI